MPKKLNTIRIIVILIMVYCSQAKVNAQGSADSRICNCFSKPVADNFMNGTKAVYGKIGIFLTKGIVLKPEQGLTVNFTIPQLESKTGCNSFYTIYVTDSMNNKIHEKTSSENILRYPFPGCNRTYNIILIAFSKSANGGDGNCSRRLNFTLITQCPGYNLPTRLINRKNR